MAIEIFSRVWKLEDKRLNPTLKLVLLSMANQADDRSNDCYPSYDYVAKRCCISKRHAIRIIGDLEEMGYLIVTKRRSEVDPTLNTSNLYTVVLNGGGSDNLSPGGSDASVTLIPTSLTSIEPSNIKPTKKLARPDDVPEGVWNDFITLRKAKKAPLTETALKGIQREAEIARLTLAQALTTCCQRGWQGFKADWVRENNHGNSSNRTGRQDSGATSLFAELHADLARSDF